MIGDRKAFPLLLALAGVAGFFLSEATHRPRYQLVSTSNPGIVHRIDTETGEAVVCMATHGFVLRCGADARAAWTRFEWGRQTFAEWDSALKANTR
jgi:hypothetical protein